MSQTTLCGGTIFDVDERYHGISDKSQIEKFASSNQQEPVYNTTPFVSILRHIGFEFVQVLGLAQVQYGPAIRSQRYYRCKHKASPVA